MSPELLSLCQRIDALKTPYPSLQAISPMDAAPESYLEAIGAPGASWASRLGRWLERSERETVETFRQPRGGMAW